MPAQLQPLSICKMNPAAAIDKLDKIGRSVEVDGNSIFDTVWAIVSNCILFAIQDEGNAVVDLESDDGITDRTVAY